MLIVQASQSLSDGDGYYRLHTPLQALGELDDVTVVDCDIQHQYFWELAERADVLILHFFSNWLFFSLIERRKSSGKVTVFETNDYFEDLQPWNPIYEPWLNPDIRREHHEYIRCCDAVQTSTHRLAGHVAGVAAQVAVFENHLVKIPPLSPPPDRPITIGWAGSRGHLADWYQCCRTLEHWLKKHPEIHLAVMTNLDGREYIDLPEDRYHFRGAGSIDDYYDFLSRIDIGIAPLLTTEYNRCRSDVKYLEYASRGVVGVYQDTDPYQATVRDGETGLLFSSPEQLVESLERLIADRELRARIREQAYAYVRNKRILRDNIHHRLEFYRQLLGERVDPTLLPPLVGVGSGQQKNFTRLKLDRLSALFTQARQQPSSPQSVQILAQITAQAPRYLLALQTLGKALCDIRQPKQAIVPLEQALQIDPSNENTLSQLGRAYFIMRDFQRAGEYLYSAIEHNPINIPAWEFYLNFLRHSDHGDRKSVVDQVQSLHPTSFGLQLMLVDLIPENERISFLEELLRSLEKVLAPNQLQHAGLQVIPKIAEQVTGKLASPEVLQLLVRTSEIYPFSARVCDLLGRSFTLHGEHDRANEVLHRSLSLHQAGRQYRGESDEGGSSPILAQVVGHLSQPNLFD